MLALTKLWGRLRWLSAKLGTVFWGSMTVSKINKLKALPPVSRGELIDPISKLYVINDCLNQLGIGQKDCQWAFAPLRTGLLQKLNGCGQK